MHLHIFPESMGHIFIILFLLFLFFPRVGIMTFIQIEEAYIFPKKNIQKCDIDPISAVDKQVDTKSSWEKSFSQVDFFRKKINATCFSRHVTKKYNLFVQVQRPSKWFPDKQKMWPAVATLDKRHSRSNKKILKDYHPNLFFSLEHYRYFILSYCCADKIPQISRNGGESHIYFFLPAKRKKAGDDYPSLIFPVSLVIDRFRRFYPYQ